MIVVDTNILVPLFIHGPRLRAAVALLERDSAWCTEPYALVELANVFSTYMRANMLALEAAHRHIAEAEALLMPHLYRVPRKTVLDVAMRYKISAYDAHFLAVADAKGQPLITEDVKLRAAAPRLTRSLDEALSA
ncbi:MAG: type II toxin-antitoxin system VapC family toxin [Xanthomonadaceae bacterium]|nr:type II toxin-antitoxin system VapC family toxin [Xanthomonadaceae bacterium]